MKRTAEVKPSVRCSVEPVAGDGSMCALSITKRAKLEEPEVADGITRRSTKLLAADGAITTKRPRKPEKPPKKNKMSKEEKNKRSNEEKNKRHKQPNQVDVVKYVSKEEQVMTELAEKSKKKIVTHVINQAGMGPFLSEEVWSYVMSIGVFTFKDCAINEIELSCDPSTEDIRFAYRRRRIENQANLLRQYRTNGHAVLQYQVTDDERDAEV